MEAGHEYSGEGRTATRPTDRPHPPRRYGGAVGPVGVAPSEDIGELLALVAHELHTPQAVIASAADTLALLLAQEEFDRAALAPLAEVIQRQSHLSSRLVARLGLAHELGRGTVTLETEQLDLTRLVQETVSDVAAFVLPGRTVAVSGDGPVPAVVDRAAISEIVMNLLTNAHKYSAAEAGIEVHVERDERRARVVVRDEGSGVAPGDTDVIFERYVQTGTHRGGLGLGLYVSRGLARAQGGELTVRPAKDVGSEFVLELPIDAA